MDFGLLYENDVGEYVVLNEVRIADIRLASLVYLFVHVSTNCVPIAHLRQNKPFPLLYLGHAQIKNEARKAKEEGKRESQKKRIQDCCVTFKPKKFCFRRMRIARTLQADILHLGQNAVKCTTCKQLVVSFIARQ